MAAGAPLAATRCQTFIAACNDSLKKIQGAKGNKKSFCRYSGDNREAGENVDPLQQEMGDLVSVDIEKAGLLNDVFDSVFTKKCSKHSPQVIKGESSRGWQNEGPPAIGKQAWDHLRELKVHKSMGTDEMHPWVLRELSEEVAKPLSIHWDVVAIWGSSQWLEKGKHNPQLQKGRKGRLGALQVGQSHFCTWQDRGADPPGNCPKAHGK